MYCFVLEFSTFLLVFVNVLHQIETYPIKMRLWYFYPAVLVKSKLKYNVTDPKCNMVYTTLKNRYLQNMELLSSFSK